MDNVEIFLEPRFPDADFSTTRLRAGDLNSESNISDDIDVSVLSAGDITSTNTTSTLVNSPTMTTVLGVLGTSLMNADTTVKRWSAQMFNSVVQSPSSGVATILAMDTTVFDTSDSANMANLASNRFDIRKTGLYKMTIKWGWAGGSLNARRGVFMFRNAVSGTPVMQDERRTLDAGSVFASSGSLSGVYPLTIGDFVTFGVFYTGTAATIGQAGGVSNINTVVATIIYVGNT
jgi:hypothetical protein